MISVRCVKTDKFPPRAHPLRAATFFSSGRTWVGFFFGLRVPATIRPLLTDHLPILPHFHLLLWLAEPLRFF